MDLFKQNKFIGWVIGVLVGLNVLTLTLVWIQSRGKTSDQSARDENPPARSVELLRSEIGFTEDQVRQYGEMRKDFQEKAKEINDELTELKLRIADELFIASSDGKNVDSMAARIGMLQSKIEVLRFEHFRELVEISNADQKEKLRPVLREVFGRKPPQGKPVDELRPRQMSGSERGRNEDKKQGRPPRRPADESREGRQGESPEEEQRPRQDDDRPGPPRIEEKLERYAQRLSLTKEQSSKVEIILKDIREEEETFKSKTRPTEDEFDHEKERLRKKEDQKIMAILDTAQKREFDNMIRNRGKRKPQEEVR